MEIRRDEYVIELCKRFPMERIHKLCTPMINKYGGIYNYDYDDFFSIANDTVYDCATRFDETKGDFDSFVLSSFKKKFKTEMTRRNRQKRIQPKDIERLDKCDEDGNPIICEIASDFCVEDNISEFMDMDERDRIERFMANISKRNKPIALFILQGYRNNEIMKILNISEKRFNEAKTEFQAYRNVKILLNK